LDRSFGGGPEAGQKKKKWLGSSQKVTGAGSATLTGQQKRGASIVGRITVVFVWQTPWVWFPKGIQNLTNLTTDASALVHYLGVGWVKTARQVCEPLLQYYHAPIFSFMRGMKRTLPSVRGYCYETQGRVCHREGGQRTLITVPQKYFHFFE